jgi:hypothetical protein
MNNKIVSILSFCLFFLSMGQTFVFGAEAALAKDAHMSAPVMATDTKTYPFLTSDGTYKQAFKNIQKAEKINKKAMECSGNQKRNMSKQALKVLKEAQTALMATLEQKLTPNEKLHIEELNQYVSKQIVWNIKFTNL